MSKQCQWLLQTEAHYGTKCEQPAEFLVSWKIEVPAFQPGDRRTSVGITAKRSCPAHLGKWTTLVMVRYQRSALRIQALDAVTPHRVVNDPRVDSVEIGA